MAKALMETKKKGEKMKNEIFVKGSLKIIKNGKVIEKVENLVVNFGLSLLAELLAGTTGLTLPNYIAIGTGGTTPVSIDTSLVSEITAARAQAQKSIGTGSNANKLTFSKYWAPNSFTGTIQEAGLFDASAFGNMFNRAIFTSVEVTSIDTFAIVWTISFNVV